MGLSDMCIIHLGEIVYYYSSIIPVLCSVILVSLIASNNVFIVLVCLFWAMVLLCHPSWIAVIQAAPPSLKPRADSPAPASPMAPG